MPDDDKREETRYVKCLKLCLHVQVTWFVDLFNWFNVVQADVVSFASENKTLLENTCTVNDVQVSTKKKLPI